VEEILELQIILPEMERPVGLQAMVRRTEDGSGQHGIAVQFLDLKDEQQDQLHQIIKFSMLKHQG